MKSPYWPPLTARCAVVRPRRGQTERPYPSTTGTIASSNSRVPSSRPSAL